ncbi:MAG TPA: ankyrin repeat domain-containing protein [Blastocatellia bacterium]|nr:ankyrin repeat domain-containing protein [Blastocatellia bacterium]
MSDLNLIEAVKAGDYNEADRLIKSGSDVNQQDEQGWTPLNFAAGKGDLSLVKLLTENGADIFKTGRDQRTPYMIALAAGRVPVVKHLMELEENYPGEKPLRKPRKYCKAYHLEEMRKFPAWTEGRINWKQKPDVAAEGNGQPAEQFDDDKVVFIHQDFTVTESVWHDENIIFNNVDSAWQEFCANELDFKVPTDLDLIVPNEANV